MRHKTPLSKKGMVIFMKKSTRILLILLAALTALAVFVFAAAAADDGEYAGSDLPVSESYVLRAIRALDEKLTAKIDTLANVCEEYRAAAEKSSPSAPSSAPSSDSTVSVSYEVVTLKRGQKLLGNCEIILRSGKANTICPDAAGISDLTAGADLPDSTALASNHLLLVPRDDGRGIIAASNTVYVMVRGTYRIEN